MRISDWSSDVCSSDLRQPGRPGQQLGGAPVHAPRSRIIAPASLRGSQNKERIMAPYPKAASRARAALRRRHRQLGQLVVDRAQHQRLETVPYLDAGSRIDRKSVVEGERGSVSEDLGGGRGIKKKKKKK